VTILEDRDQAKQQARIAAKANELRAAGKNVYIPRQPDTVDLDVIAYADSALEVARQCRDLGIEPSSLYLCALDTTQAGVVLGLSYLDSSIRIKGISPFEGMPGRCKNMADMANQAADRLDLDIEFMPDDFDNDDSFVGERYGIPTAAGIEAINLVAQTEGILLDPVYTSKAMSALIAHIRQGQLASDAPVVFLHTGGAPALFGYVDDILAG
jgi:D-cysteine desulfhydrase/L-cysteate sulfo-lyase